MDRALNRGHPAAGGSVASLLDAVSASLRGGVNLRAGLDAAAVDGELAPVVRAVLARVDAGTPLRDALVVAMRGRSNPELRLAFGAMALALDTGAAHASTLELIAQRVRDRVALEREIRALSAPARASAVVVSIAPLVFGLLVLVIDPPVVVAAIESAAGRGCVVGGLMFDLVGAWWMRRLLVGPHRSRTRAGPSADLPEAVDLLAMAMAAGHRVPAAIRATALYADGDSARVLRVSAARLDAGEAPVAVVQRLADAFGDEARQLVAALVASHHDGVPGVDALHRVASDLRHARRQRAAERAQRLPVDLLFPLVCCVLPAFLLLSVLPLAIGSIDAMRG